MTDYYSILGLKKDCTEEEIKKAYKKAAIKHHPDKGGDAEKFKELSHAYETLKDPEKRQIYDQYGEEGLKNGGVNFTDPFEMFNVFGKNFGFDINNMGNFGQHFGFRSNNKPRPQPTVYNMNIPLEDIYKGLTKKIRITTKDKCVLCEGTGSQDKNVDTCNKCSGTGVEYTTQKMGPMVFQTQQPCSLCNSRGFIIPDEKKCKTCNGTRRIDVPNEINLVIPKGTGDGAKMVLEGKAGYTNDKIDIPADLVIIINEKQNNNFKRHRNHLIIEKTINLYQSLFDSDIFIKHLDDRVIKIKLDKVIQPNTWIRVKGQGMVKENNTGDLFIQLKVRIPEIRKNIKELFEKILVKQYENDNKENFCDFSDFSYEIIDNINRFL